MLTLTFLQQTELDITKIAEVWRKFVTQQQVTVLDGGSRWRISFQVQPEDSSYRYRALMQKPQLVLKFSLPFYFEFPVGTQCVFQNQRFILTRAQDLKKQGTRKIEYSMTLGTNEDYFAQWKIRNIVDPVESGENAPKDNRLKFSLCAKPHEFVDLIVRNLNKKDTSVTWSRGECIEAAEKTVEFNHTYIDAGLTDICNAFSTEYEVEYLSTTAAKIHLRRVEYFKTDPVALSYGVGNGFIPGVGRTSEADGLPVKRMLVQGSDRNIDRSKYGAPELMLPKSQTIRYDGTHFEDEDGFNEAIARTYQSNADGDGVERIDKVSDAIKEDSLDCSEIYPSRVGEVTSVEVANAEKNFYDIIDATIPPELNFNNYLIAGETMTIIFQDGMLAGKEFDVKYKHEQRKFEIVPQEIDGIMMPNETWCPQEKQTYAIFGIMLPDQYICNDSDKSGGSWDMMRAAVKALYEVEDQRFTFSGSLQALWAKRHWLDVGGKLVVGGHVLFQDDQFAKDGAVIRIVGIKDFLTQPYSPTIELSNSVSAGGSVASQIRQITNTEVVIEDTEKRMMQYTKRRFRDALETIGMLEDAHIGDFTGSVSPVAVQTMAMLVGDESLQFRFAYEVITTNEDGTQSVAYSPTTQCIGYDNDKKQLFATMQSDGMNICLQHMTLGQNAIMTQARRDDRGYITWPMKSYTSPVLDEPTSSYYLYAKVSSTDNTQEGEFVLSQKAIAMEAVDGYYHLLCGVLNSELEGHRSYVSMYGFTEILPGRITTDLLIFNDGESYVDLANSRFKLGDKLDFNVDGDNVLRLRGALVQSSNGDEFPIPCYRGEYSATARYYRGDLVSYKTNGSTSMYLCKTTAPNGIVGLAPTSTNYWSLYAEGAQGKPGDNGQNAPILVFRGNWDSSKTYYGNSSRVDCVKSGNAYYVTQINAPNGTNGFSGIDTSNGNYWKLFGASFESIATGLLLAENANIANLIFKNQRLESSAKTNGDPNIFIDGISGNAKFGWIRFIGNELIGYDTNGIERFKLTPEKLPSATDNSSKQIIYPVSCDGHTDAHVNIDRESFDATYNGYYLSGHDDLGDDDNSHFWCSVDLDIPADNVVLYLTDQQCGVYDMTDAAGRSFTGNVNTTVTATIKRIDNNEVIGSVDLLKGSPQITIPKAGKIRITISVSVYASSDWYGTLYVAFKGFQCSRTNTETIIAQDGIMSIFNGNYMRMHSTEGFSVKFGNQYFRITSGGIEKSTNGSSWDKM